MSFGFGVGDFLAVAKLANDIWQKLHDSVGQFADIRDEVKGYSSLLYSVSTTVSNQYLAPEQADGLDASARACRSVLEDLRKLVDKYRRLTNEAHGLTANVRQKAKILQWDQDDARDLRARITSTTTVLRGLCETIARDQQARRELCQWLSPLDFPAQQREIYSRHQHGSGQWLLQSERFKRWLESEGGVLLCPGDPGAGKTVLASIAINHLWNEVRTDRIGVAYIYCDYLKYQEQSHVHLVGSLLKQLAEQRNPISGSLRNHYDEHKISNTDPTPRRTFEVLKAECDSWSRVFLIVDALDECSEKDATRQRLVEGLLSLQGSNRINILVTTRPIPSILCEFEVWERLAIRANSADIQKYLLGQMDRFSKRVVVGKDLQEQIISAIIDAADGMFLLARLTFESLVGQRNVKAIKDTLNKLSRGADALDSAYDDAMKRIEEQDQASHELAIRTLSWIIQGQRLLSVAEIQQAVSIEPGNSGLDPDSTVDCDDIISACAGLVTRFHDSPNNEILRLVHYTTQEYFERKTTKYFPDAQKYLASSCLTYLLFDIFSGTLCLLDQDGVRSNDSDTGVGTETTEDFCFGCKTCWNAEQHEERAWAVDPYWDDPCLDLRTEQYPFYEYAVWYWGHHAENCDDEAIRILTTTFLDDTRRVTGMFRHSLCVKFYPDDSVRLKLEDFNPGSAMQLAAFLGLTKVASKLLEDGFEPDVKDWSGVTPLSWAVIRGHEDVVKLLITREDVDLNVRDQNGKTPLEMAVIEKHIAIVKLLLACENIELTANYDLSALVLLYASGHDPKNLQLLKLLLACDHVEVNAKDWRGQTPLMTAAYNDNVESTRLLLARDDIQINVMDDNGQTALHRASVMKGAKNMQLLLARNDIQPNIRDSKGRTALHIAAIKDWTAGMRLLLAHEDIQVNARNNEGATALHIAAKQVRTMSLLLAHGDIQINERDNNGRTALHYAAPEEIRLLLACDNIDINVRDECGSTALHLTAEFREIEAVQLLLARDDLEVNATDDDGESALFRVLKNAYDTPILDVAELFLARGDVHLNMRDMDGCTPLYHAVRSGRPDVVQLLLTREDLKISIKDGEGESLVSLAEHKWDKAEGKNAMDAYDRIIDLLRSYIQRKLQLYAHLAYLDLAF